MMTGKTRAERPHFRLLHVFAGSREGATAIEYALIAVGIAMAIVAVLPEIGPTLAGMYAAVLDGF